MADKIGGVFSRESMLKHVVCIGNSGAGKTVALKGLVEDMALAGVPGIVIDTQGDLAALALVNPPNELHVEYETDEEIDRKRYANDVEVVIWTPTTDIGRPLCINPLAGLAGVLKLDINERVRAYTGVATMMCDLAGYDSKSSAGRSAVAILDCIISKSFEAGKMIASVEDLADMAFLSQGDEQIEKVAKESQVEELARRLAQLNVGMSRLLYTFGEPMSINNLLGIGLQKTRISVIYLNPVHSDDMKKFIIGAICEAMYTWMMQTPRPELRAFMFLDEIGPYVPPTNRPQPQSADSIVMMLKQGRKYGVCMMLASQNTTDINYKATSNASTFIAGRLQAHQDREQVRNKIDDKFLGRLPFLKAGDMLVHSPDNFERTKEWHPRWPHSQHRTLSDPEVREITKGAKNVVCGKVEQKDTAHEIGRHILDKAKNGDERWRRWVARWNEKHREANADTGGNGEGGTTESRDNQEGSEGARNNNVGADRSDVPHGGAATEH